MTGRRPSMRLGRRRLLGALLVVVSAAGACQTADDRPTFVDTDLASVLEQLGSGSGELEGTITIDGRVADITGEFEGRTLVGDGSGIVTGAVPLEPEVPLDVRWTDGRVLSTRAQVPGVGPAWALLLVSSSVSGPGSVETPMTLLSGAIEPLFPAAIVERFATVEPDSSQSVGDSLALTFPYSLVGVVGTGGEATVTLTVSAEGSLEHVTVRIEDEAFETVLDYDVSMTDRGPDVSLPDVTATTVAPPAPTGDFVEVQRGTVPALDWRVLKAPSRSPISCWKAETDPAIVVRAPNVGQDIRCLADPDPEDPLSDQVVALVSSDGTTDAALLVMAVPEGASDVRLGFFGGALTAATARDGVLVWAGANTENPVLLELRVGDTTVVCGLGAVSGSADLDDEMVADVRLGLPWTCQEG